MYTYCILYTIGVGGVTDDDRCMLSARVPEELKELVDVDPRTNQEIVEAALWREFGGEKKGSLERRIEEKKRRESIIESEKNERDRELQEVRKERKALEEKLDKTQAERAADKDAWYQKVRRVPRDESHPLVQDASDALGIDTATVLKEAYNE
jgi:septal ring factor EnvC (AmiA/AmiB activator)